MYLTCLPSYLYQTCLKSKPKNTTTNCGPLDLKNLLGLQVLEMTSITNKFQWHASLIFPFPFQAWFPPCAALLCLHALTRFVSWEKSISIRCMIARWDANFGSFWESYLMLLFCCAAVYLVAQYARREIKRMEAVIYCDLLWTVINGIK